MRGKSHRCLGNYLVQRYMGDAPQSHIKAFLLGCIEPDRNPATYLKGSYGINGSGDIITAMPVGSCARFLFDWSRSLL